MYAYNSLVWVYTSQSSVCWFANDKTMYSVSISKWLSHLYTAFMCFLQLSTTKCQPWFWKWPIKFSHEVAGSPTRTNTVCSAYVWMSVEVGWTAKLIAISIADRNQPHLSNLEQCQQSWHSFVTVQVLCSTPVLAQQLQLHSLIDANAARPRVTNCGGSTLSVTWGAGKVSS